MKREYILLVVCFSLLIIISACAVLENETNNKTEQPSVEDSKEQEVASANRADIHTLEYGDQMGLELYPPKNKVATSMPLQGEIDESDELNEDYVWVVIRKKDHMDDISDKEFEYYIPIEDGQFSKELNLHHGKGEYNVNVRLPSNEENEEDTYYDAAEYQINNLEEDIERDVEISKFGHEKGIELADDINGWNKAEQAFQINGTVGEDYNESEILAEVEKDNEQHNIIIPIEDGSFSDEIPLNYGKGVHSIRLQLKDEGENEDLYYESANLYVDNQSDQELLEFNEYEDYVDSGVMLESPSQKTGMELNEVEYPIKGTIDEDAPRADDISHIIVDVEQLDNHDKATYFIPVEDNSFEGMTHFRFGPGTYEVTIHIPKAEQESGSKFYYNGILSVTHDVRDIKDKRDILPSRGTESDDPEIMEKAKEITEGLEDDKQKAKAIYEYVAKNIDYDVEKYKADEFNLDDSAIDTLESKTGICQDYTFLTTALLRSIDIESRYIEGHAGVRHAWVEAKVDGEWIELDPTWGAGYVTDDDEFISEYNEDYFDPDEELLTETHTRENIMY